MKITVNVPDGDIELAAAYLEQVGDSITALVASGNPPGGPTRYGAEFPARDTLVAGWWKVEL